MGLRVRSAIAKHNGFEGFEGFEGFKGFEGQVCHCDTDPAMRIPKLKSLRKLSVNTHKQHS